MRCSQTLDIENVSIKEEHYKEFQIRILRDSEKETPSNIFHFNIPESLRNEMEEQSLEACLNIAYDEPQEYVEEAIFTFVSIPT